MMPVYRTGDMWSVFDEVDNFLVTTNSYIKTNGAIVMGRGAAYRLKTEVPGIDLELGELVESCKDSDDFYGVVIKNGIGAFQVKYHFKDKAMLYLIKRSSEMLAEEAARTEETYCVNFPGVGYGYQEPEDVLPLLSVLPNNVQVWSY